MNAIKDMMQINYTTFIVWIFALLFGIKEIIELLSYFKRKFGVKTTLDTNKESMENRIATLEKHDDWQYKEISNISKGIEEIRKNLLSKEIQDLRWELLDFCSTLTNGRIYNREAFEHVFRSYEDYEKILSDNGMTNGYVEESMNVIKEMYHEQLASGKIK